MEIKDCFNLAEKIYNTFSSKSLKEETAKQLITQVTSSEKLGIFERQQIADAIIYNTGILKSKNKADILQKAMNILKEKDPELLSGIRHINDEWLLNFFDCCENTTDDDMRTMWAKILVGECEKKGKISKRLLDILRVIDKNSAEKFGILCAHSIKMYANDGITYLKFILPKYRFEKYNNKIIDEFLLSFDVKAHDISELVNLGLIEECEFSYVYEYDELKFDYYGSKLLVKRIDGKNYIDTGAYQFAKCGMELARILHDDMILSKDNNYIYFLIEYYKSLEIYSSNDNNPYSVEILSN